MSFMFEKILGHARPIRILVSSIERGTVAQAYLFHGEEGIGKRTVEVGPEGTAIKIGQVRALQAEIHLPPILGKRKIYLIDNADRLNIEAANALLKTLEEPPPHAVLILIAHRLHLLPETLRSRCQKILFTPPSTQETERWLVEETGCTPQEARLRIAVSGGRPGAARLLDGEEAEARAKRSFLLTSPEGLASLPDLFALSEEFSRDPETFLSALRHLSLWLRDRRVDGIMKNPEPGKDLAAETIDRIFDLIQTIHGALHRNINRQLALDVVLLELRKKMPREQVT
jgi:DNA polymerase-3 subunit delta'